MVFASPKFTVAALGLVLILAPLSQGFVAPLATRPRLSVGKGARGAALPQLAGRRHAVSSPRSFEEAPEIVASTSPLVSSVAVAATPEVDVATEAPNTPSEKPTYGETTARSVVKALTWRVTAAVVTLVSGIVFSGSMKTAMSIVGSDFITKSGFMFVGERVWNKVKWGQGAKGDSNQRSLAKAVLWRVFAAANTLFCGAILAKDLSVASKIAGSDTFFKTGLFFFNERIWNQIKWGKTYEPEYFI
ncbi:unnamed protein product [Discosporangium mesarthrocarpum]